MTNLIIKNNYETMPLGQILRAEWIYLFGGALCVLAVASILMSGSVFPMLSTPFLYAGDSIFHSWLTQRVMEGWFFENPRSGFPFGSQFLDFPGSDFANHLVLKFLGLISGTFQGAMNLYFLMGFFVTFIFSYLALRKFGLTIIFALTGAFIFDFLPFHFLRLGHIFYTWYFVVPIFFSLGFFCFNYTNEKSLLRIQFRKFALLFISLIFIASFGVYNSLYGVIVLCVSGVAGAIAHKNLKPLWMATACVVMLAAGVVLNLVPNIDHRNTNGTNTEVAQRSPSESEIYGLKLMQLIIPRTDHRSERLSDISRNYNQTTPLVNENATASIGVIGVIGLAVLLVVMVIRLAGAGGDDRLSLFALFVLILFLFGTIGGFGSLFSYIVSPAIRGWNRISIFIGFGAITAFLIVLQAIIQHYFNHQRSKTILKVVGPVLILFAFYDQTTPACSSCIEQTRRNFEHDRTFVQAIEKQLSPGAAVYQLPYMPFPEVPPQHQLPDYGLMVGFLHSKALNWSYGGTKGRPGDLFFRSLSNEPIERQIEVIKKLGFSGVYIDRRGYQDNGKNIVAQITAELGYGPSVEHETHKLVFFPVSLTNQNSFVGDSAHEIMSKVGYFSDRLGKRHFAKLSDGIDFRLSTWPEFIRDVQGMSGHEPWGRWSDANVDRIVKFEFFSPLPKKFTLVIHAKAFGWGGEQEFLVRIGSQSHRLILHHRESEIRLPIVLSDTKNYAIEFIPQYPISPKKIGLSADSRMLGIGFVRLDFEP